MAATVPLLDVSQFRQASPADHEILCQELLKGFSRYGFVRLINHGIPDDVIMDLFSWTRRFFNLQYDDKACIAHSGGPDPQRGWSRVGEERTAKLFRRGEGGEAMVDAREHFDQGSPFDTKYPNRFPSSTNLPGFRSFMEKYYTLCQTVSMQILHILEVSLHIPSGIFTSKCQSQASELRLNHYPEISLHEMQQGSVSRIHPHTDLGVITCLFQDGLGGLEVKDRLTNDWVPIQTTSTSELIINISETFERWTNGKVKAGIHQVTIPPHLKSYRSSDSESDNITIPSRLSSAFFVKADREAFVGALEPFISEERPKVFKDMTALEYHQMRLATAYAKQTV